LILLAAGSVYYLQHRQEWARLHAHDRYQQFVQRRDEALFQGTLLAAVRLGPQDWAVSDLRAIRASAEEALALAGVGVDGGTDPPPAPYLTAEEQADLRASCYELLLVLAEAVGQSLPGTTPEDQRQQTAEALRILDRASRLSPPTRALHLYRAHLLAR